jgi:hypothetical protein
VYPLTAYHGELIASGTFSGAALTALQEVARWDGTQWQALGTGIGGLPSPIVYALTVYNDDLIVGGYFTQAGGEDAHWIAQWDGRTWSALGTGIDGLDTPGFRLGVLALTVYPESSHRRGRFRSRRWRGGD